MEVVACWPGAGSPATPCCVPSHTISARRPGPRTVLRPLTMAADAPSDSAARRRRAPEASPTEAAPPQRGATAMAKGGAPSPSWWAGALGENGGDKDTAGGLGSGGGGQGQVAQQWRRGRAAWAAARPHPLPPLPTLPSPPPPSISSGFRPSPWPPSPAWPPWQRCNAPPALQARWPTRACATSRPAALWPSFRPRGRRQGRGRIPSALSRRRGGYRTWSCTTWWSGFWVGWTGCNASSISARGMWWWWWGGGVVVEVLGGNAGHWGW